MKLLSFSQLAVASVFVAGLCGATVLTLGPVYALAKGFATAYIALFMASYILGATIVPLGVGSLSDYVPRRYVLVALAFGAFLCCGGAALYPDALMFFNFLLGGFLTSLYSVAVSTMNDYLKPSQVVSATSSMILLNSLSSCFGPVLIGGVLQLFGVDTFFLIIAVIVLFAFSFGAFRAAFAKNKLTVEEQGDYVAMPARGGHLLMEMHEE